MDSKASENVKASVSGNVQAEKAAAAAQQSDDLQGGKINWQKYNRMWNEMKPNSGFIKNAPVKVNAGQLQAYTRSRFHHKRTVR